MPDEYGKGSDGPCSTSSSTTRPTLTCSFVGEAFEPSGELVGALDLPCHARNYAIDSIMRLELYSAVVSPGIRPFWI